MPEGHTIHRHARVLRERFAGRPVEVSSPQGRFTAGAAALDGRVVTATEAHGKHLFLRFAPRRADEPAADFLHVHLGLYGTWTLGEGEPPQPRGALRLRLSNGEHWADLRGPIACEVLDTDGRGFVLSRLGPDPLRRDADPGEVFARVQRSRAPIGLLLMQQDVVSGIGNVYRAEILFRHGLDPARPGRSVARDDWDALWDDLVTLMRAGVRSGRIVTTRPEHRSRRTGAARREDAHYVYRRHGLPCRVCGTAVELREAAGRKLYWCPADQAG
ncbi:MAG: Fpg/Nei family DNA glycosylase [Kineosporiaceae bacterium]